MPTPDSPLDTLTRLVQMISHDKGWQRWFFALAKGTDLERQRVISDMTERLAAEQEDDELVRCFSLLADPRIFAAAEQALRACGCTVDELHERRTKRT